MLFKKLYKSEFFLWKYTNMDPFLNLFIDCEIHVIKYTYSNNGVLLTKTSYVHNTRHGQHLYYYANGVIMAKT